ncbi:MAG: TatD family hydrolase [Anaerolineae bacterium]
MQLIDTHAHLHAEQFDEDRDAVIRRMREAGVTGVVTIGTDVPASRAAIDLADQHPDIWATVGVDPHEAASFSNSTLDELRGLAGSPQVVAIGEIGLDYYWDKAPRQVQARVFERQLELARALRLPVVIHNREAHADTLAMLREWAGDHPWHGERPLGVLHCFSGDAEMALAAIEIGFMISLAGPVTFKNAKKPVAVAGAVPLEWLVVETDAPYLAPHPHRGQRNEPAYLPLTAQRIADIKGIPVETVAEATLANSKVLFAVT